MTEARIKTFSLKSGHVSDSAFVHFLFISFFLFCEIGASFLVLESVQIQFHLCKVSAFIKLGAS